MIEVQSDVTPGGFVGRRDAWLKNTHYRVSLVEETGLANRDRHPARPVSQPQRRADA